VPHLEPYPHHRCPLNVVGLGKGRPPTARTDVTDNGLDSMVSMVPVQGGRATPPIKLRSPSTQPSARLCLSGLRPLSGARPPRVPLPGTPSTRSCPSGLLPPCPWGCTATHCAAYSCVTSLASLSSLSLSSSAETELPVLLVRRASSFAAAARVASAAAAASTSVFAAVSSAIASLAALAIVAAVCRRSLVFLSRSNLGLLPVLRARGDRALRLSFRHDALVGAATWGRGCLR
jgi:hypothetical protein